MKEKDRKKELGNCKDAWFIGRRFCLMSGRGAGTPASVASLALGWDCHSRSLPLFLVCERQIGGPSLCF